MDEAVVARPAREEAEETERRPDTAAAAGRPEGRAGGPETRGSNRRRGRARKGYEPWRPILVEVELRGPVKTPTFRAIAQEAAEMLERGLRLSAIARHFGVDYHTVDKAIRWYRWRCFVISRSAVRVRSPAPIESTTYRDPDLNAAAVCHHGVTNHQAAGRHRHTTGPSRRGRLNSSLAIATRAARSRPGSSGSTARLPPAGRRPGIRAPCMHPLCDGRPERHDYDQ